jgi:hypothetical protein
VNLHSNDGRGSSQVGFALSGRCRRCSARSWRDCRDCRRIIRTKVRLSEVDRPIGAAGVERERHKSQKDRDPHSRPPVHWRPAHKRAEFTWRSSSRVQVDAASPSWAAGASSRQSRSSTLATAAALRPVGIRKPASYVAICCKKANVMLNSLLAAEALGDWAWRRKVACWRIGEGHEGRKIFFI